MYLGKTSLSKQETIEAWKMERLYGKTRAAAAMRFSVMIKTLCHMYCRYKLPYQHKGGAELQISKLIRQK